MIAEVDDPVGRLFAAALDLPAADRDGFLAADPADPAVRAEVRELLDHLEGALANGFLESTARGPAAGAGDSADLAGRTLGPYRVECEVGRGGFGTVYRAARDDGQYRGTVAVKVLRRGLDTDDILRRFAGERQALAGLGRHPNVVTLLDAGCTPDGRPYVVMEYVEGEPIDRYCDGRRLPVPDRLRLFLTVCEAVQHAHRHLVVHRDLKPQNVLVAADGRVKLLDFGIAKFLDPAAAGRTDTPTAPGRAPLTPAYASPEQARGGPVDVTTDVYSLGVVLYELLTGQLPYPGGHPADRDRPPEKPSTKVVTTGPGGAAGTTTAPDEVAARRAARPAQLRRLLAGDLDNIVLRALAPEPGRRYPSAVEFAQDVRRYLAGEPVAARGNPWGYRAGKFVRRHAVGLAAAAAAFLAMAGLAGWAVVERGRAIDGRNQADAAEGRAVRERNHAAEAEEQAVRDRDLATAARAKADERFDQAWKLARTLITEFTPRIQHLAGARPAMEYLAFRALNDLDALAADAGDNPAVLNDLAGSYLKKGDIQFSLAGPNRGRAEQALASHLRGRDLMARLVAAYPADPAYRFNLATFHERVGTIQKVLGRREDARVSYQACLDFGRSAAGDKPADPNYRRAVGLALDLLGDLRLEAGDPDGALVYFRDALAIYEGLLRGREKLPDLRLDRALSLGKIGKALYAQGRYAEALERHREQAQILAALRHEQPHNAGFRGTRASALDSLGDTLEVLGRPAEALAAYLEGAATWEALAAADPNDMLARRSLGQSAYRQGTAHFRLGSDPGLPGRDRREHLQTARERFRTALAVQEGMKTDGTLPPSDEHLLGVLADCLAQCEKALAEFVAPPPRPAGTGP